MNSFGYIRDQPRPAPLSKQEREELEEKDREARIAMLSQQQAKYYGFCSPDGTVRPGDLATWMHSARRCGCRGGSEMGLMQRRKGKSFEQRIARDLREALPTATIRRSLQAHRAYESDVVVEGDAPPLARRLWLELTDSRAPSPLDKLAQAERDLNALALWHTMAVTRCLPVVVWHKTAAKDIWVTMRGKTWAEFVVAGAIIGPADGIPVTLDWRHFLDVLRGMVPKQEAA